MSKTLEELRAEATEKGISFDGRLGKRKLQEKINSIAPKKSCAIIVSDEVEDHISQDEIVEPVVYEKLKIKNISKNRYEIGSFSMDSLEVVELSERQMSNEVLMKRINHHIDIKKFKRMK